MSKRTLTDAQWARIEPLVPGKKGDPGRSATDNRLFLDAVLWLARTASPWRDLRRDLLPELGNWRTAHCRFWRWTLAGVWEGLFNTLSADPDFEYVLVDPVICNAHADASSAKGGLKLTQSVAPRVASGVLRSIAVKHSAIRPNAYAVANAASDRPLNA